MAQFREILRQLFFLESPLMIIDLPSYDPDYLPDDSKPKDFTHKPKAVFQWPPDCLWPFIDQGSEKDT
jgi:hypothetical protein